MCFNINNKKLTNVFFTFKFQLQFLFFQDLNNILQMKFCYNVHDNCCSTFMHFPHFSTFFFSKFKLYSTPLYTSSGYRRRRHFLYNIVCISNIRTYLHEVNSGKRFNKLFKKKNIIEFVYWWLLHLNRNW